MEMTENQKNIGIGIMIAGFGVIIANIFVKAELFKAIAKPLAYILLAVGCIYFIAGDAIINIFKKATDKEYKQQQASMTPQQKLELKKQEYDMKMEEMKMKLELEKKRAEIDKIKATTAKLKQSEGTIGQQIKGMIGDPISNLGLDQKSKAGDLSGFMIGGQKQQEVEPKQKPKKRKMKYKIVYM